MLDVRRGRKRRRGDSLDRVQRGSREWWESTPMTYDWRGEAALPPRSVEWFDNQDRRSDEAHRHFATERIPFDLLIPYESLRGKDVLEIGTGAGFHAELLARAGARVTGIDLTLAAIETTQRRFALRGLSGTFERWDAEQPRDDFRRRFDFVWSWGVIHHSSHTARIVRNVGQWLREEGAFAGMVYHRDSTSAAAVLIRDWILRGRFLSQSFDETLWRSSDGFTARFYPADQWRDLLLGFFQEAQVGVTGNEGDVLPLPRFIRRPLVRRLPPRLRDRILARTGSFVTFSARRPFKCAA